MPLSANSRMSNHNVRRAYARGAHWDERVKMMAWWGDYLDSAQGEYWKQVS